LHIYGTGEGSPTVVLDSGYNGSWFDWSWVQPEVAKFTRVVSYDCAGLGWSDPAKPRSIQRIVNELHRLLANAGVGGPYVMVGQSSGGMNVRVYASQHPQDVVGMVLVDAAYEDWPEIKLQAPSRGGYSKTCGSRCYSFIRSSPGWVSCVCGGNQTARYVGCRRTSNQSRWRSAYDPGRMTGFGGRRQKSNSASRRYGTPRRSPKSLSRCSQHISGVSHGAFQHTRHIATGWRSRKTWPTWCRTALTRSQSMVAITRTSMIPTS
jgi:pimeloyl-ACP methyl ester carboxylesterase